MSQEGAYIVAVLVVLVLWQLGVVRWAWRRFVVRPVVSVWRRGPAKGERPAVPSGVRFSVFKRDGFKCVYCGYGRKDGRKLHLDHYKPWRITKNHDPKNFVTACQPCNAGKGGRVMKRPIEDFVR